MDHILYKTKVGVGVYKNGKYEDLDIYDMHIPISYHPSSSDYVCYYIYYIMRFCTQCYGRSWGIWQVNTTTRLRGNPFADLDETPGYARMRTECDYVLSMDKCPICGCSLKPEHRYIFASASDLEKQYSESKFFLRFGAKLICSRQDYTIDQLRHRFPGWKCPSMRKEGEDAYVFPDGSTIFCRYVGNNEICVWNFFNNDFESLCAFIDRNMRLIVAEKGVRRLGSLTSNCENIEPSAVRYRAKNSDQLKAFLHALVEVEKNIYAVSERLKELYPVEYVAEKAVFRANKVAIKQVVESAKKAEEELKKLRAQKPTKGMSIEQIEISLPEAPVAPTKPQPPIIRKPGLFNKKRVLAENAMLTSEYEKACAIYEEESRQHQKKLIAHGEIVRKLEEDRRKRYQAWLNDLNRQHQALVQEQEKQLLRAKETVAAAEKAQANALSPKAVGLQSVKQEIQQAEDIFRKLYAVRRDMYMSGVVFPKYHNLVAISSFYEYVCSGRCESLDGVNGAYNIYENEIRMNAVISQLSQVIEKLDAIREGQYVLYSAISEVNSQLNMMNKAMDTMNESLARMDQKLTNIDKNAEVVAYNSAVTAYYTKKNAELTDALGYLIALK